MPTTRQNGSATAEAHPNIALIKYWGKRDERLIIPVTGSVSVTLAAYHTRTTVTLDSHLKRDMASIVGPQQGATEQSALAKLDYAPAHQLHGKELARVQHLLEEVRNISGTQTRAYVASANTVPTAAGLASSASGFAALALAATQAYGLDLDLTEVSRIARLGSGSAARSLHGGMVYWHPGHDGAQSFNPAEADLKSVAHPIDWPGPELETVIAVVSASRKEISSREAMNLTGATSPYFDAWVKDNSRLVMRALAAIKKADFNELGELTELSTMRMHAVMLAAEPAIRYLAPTSLQLFDAVKRLRDNGIAAYATADAGPNVKILCQAKDAAVIVESLQTEFLQVNFLRSKIGGPATVVAA